MTQLTITAIKADVGSRGGHTAPSCEMIENSKRILQRSVEESIIKDFRVTFTGDDICLLMTHHLGDGATVIHNLAWEILMESATIAKNQGLYGAGQDLLKDAPSGNVRGAGPGAAEITFDTSVKERRAEAFLVFTADKCGPGAFNLPLYLVFTNPMFCMGLMLPNMIEGFDFIIIDMEHTGGDRTLKLKTPEMYLHLAALLRDENRYGILKVTSRKYPEQQVVSTSTDRLHSIAGTYKGKDDPVCIVRSQGIFPAPEEIIMPYVIAPYVAGDARGSHHMTLMPVAIDTPVTGPYCQPIVSCMAYSVTADGYLSEGVDMFGNVAWDSVRRKALEKSLYMREQGFFGTAMLPNQELEYSVIMETINKLDGMFTVS